MHGPMVGSLGGRLAPYTHFTERLATSIALCSLFRCLQNSKTLQDFPSHRIFERMHKVLNVAKQNN